MKLSRRQVLRAGAGGVAAIGASQIGRQEMSWAHSPILQTSNMPQSEVMGPVSAAKRALRELLDGHRLKYEQNVYHRIGFLEADIHSLRSVSVAAKIRMQAQRDEEKVTTLKRLQKMVFG